MAAPAVICNRFEITMLAGGAVCRLDLQERVKGIDEHRAAVAFSRADMVELGALIAKMLAIQPAAETKQ